MRVLLCCAHTISRGLRLICWPDEASKRYHSNMRSDNWRPTWGLSNGRTGVNPDRLYQNPDGRWEVPAPVDCPNGHRYRGGHTLVGTHVCTHCGTHRTYTCLDCEAAGMVGVVHWPPWTDECLQHDFDGRAERAVRDGTKLGPGASQ